MDLAFRLNMLERAEFLRQMMHSFGLTYVCLWHPHRSNLLQGLNGVYEEEEPSSSSRTLAGQLFSVYQSLEIDVDAGRVPGLAFRTNNPYMELRLPENANLAYAEVQLQFYQAAGIQTVVFIGCNLGEIELGMTCEPQLDLKMGVENIIQQVDQAMSQGFHPSQLPASSSSFSLKSFDSIDPQAFIIQETLKDPLMGESSLPLPPIVSTSHQQSINQIRNIGLPSIQNEEAAMTSAILAVLSSSSQPNPSAFRRYQHSLAPVTAATRKQSLFKRSLYYLHIMDNVRKQYLQMQAAQNLQPITAQSWQHMMKERTRRRKITDILQVLRSLLPPGSKKDKASVLRSTAEYLSTLKSQVEELIKRNQMLESQLLVRFRMPESSRESAERVTVEIVQVSSSSPLLEGRFLDLRVSVREECRMLNLVIGLLGFLKQQRNLSILCMESMSESDTPMHGIMLRLRITEGDEFDEGGFQEAVRRVLEDLLH